jgi:acetolactate synthase-1/2/3 large subunit
MHGNVSSNKAIVDCDLLLAFGVRFSDRVLSNKKGFAENATIIHVDIDKAELGKNIKPTIGIQANIKDFLTDLYEKINVNKHENWLKEVNSWKKLFSPYKSSELNGRSIMENIYEITKGTAIITTEVGQHQMWAGQYYDYLLPRTFISSGGLGTMGFGTGAAMGSQVANPTKTVINIAGDGSFRMNLTELATIVEYDLPIIIVIVNNQVLGMVRQWQTAFYEKRYSQTDLNRGPDFQLLATAYGIKSYRVKTVEEYRKALDEAIKSRKPAIIETIILKDDKVLPMVAPGGEIVKMILE